MTAEDDGADYDSDVEIEDPGYVDPQDGEFKRPWCPATRILEHRENERLERYGTCCMPLRAHGQPASPGHDSRWM